MFFAVAVAALTGCSKDEEMTVAPVEAETKTISEIVVGMEPGTRVYMGANYKVYWDEGDVITVWSDKGNKADFIFSAYLNEDKTQARFQAQNVQDIEGSRFYAVYPAITGNPTNLGGGSWRVTTALNGEQLYRPDVEANAGTYSRGVAPIAAQTMTINDLDQAVFTFSNLCSLIELQLKGAENLVVNGISLEATISSTTNVGLYGDANITFPSNVADAPELAVTSGRTGRNTLSLTGLSIAMSSAPKTFYFVVPSNVAVTKLKFTIEGYNTADNSALSISKSRTFEKAQYFDAGKLNQIGANFTVAVAQRYAVGDYYNENGLEGVVFSVNDPDANNTSLHGKIVALNNLPGTYVWATENLGEYVAGFTNTDGWNNLQTAIKMDASLAKFPAFKACQEVGAKWYLPSQAELTTLIGTEANLAAALEEHSGSTLVQTSYWTSNNDGGQYGDVIYAIKGRRVSWDYSVDYNVDSYSVRPIAQF